jgi:peptide/nickel transport system permease protein
MLRIVTQRLLLAIPVLLVVTLAVFMLLSLVPGDPAVTLAGGQSATPEAIAQVREQLHLNDPLLVQYAHWLGGVLRFHLGNSILTGQSISSSIEQRFPVTFGLTVAATLVAVIVGVPLGIVSGLFPGRFVDGGVRGLASLALAVPNFWLAVMLVSLLGVKYRWFPTTGYVSWSDSPTGWLRSITLPAIALGLALAANLARQLRISLIEVMDSNYIRTAWAKGAGTGRIVVRHALKNASIPTVTVIGVQLGYLLGGTVIIEQIFSLPGLGSYMIQAIDAKDLPVVQGVVLVFALFQVAMSLLVDISYGYLNPRVRVA